ncbi:MAG: hypothetical protein ACREX0_00570 [Noviherbaspirillum sp.]
MHWNSPQPSGARFMRDISSRRFSGTLLTCIALLMFAPHGAAQTVWPRVELPKGAHAFNVADGVVTANGLPMRMQGFLSSEAPTRLANWFRGSLEKPLVENTVAQKLILGRAQGDHYITVQLEPAGKGTRGLVAVTHLKAVHENQVQTQTSRENWLLRLPSGSRLLSQVSSEDAGKIATHLVITNGHSEDLNRERLASLMREDGLELEREAAPDMKRNFRPEFASGENKTLFFKGRNKEAIAVISRAGLGTTTIVLNTITAMGRFK